MAVDSRTLAEEMTGETRRGKFAMPWWAMPVFTVVVLGGFIVYAFFRGTFPSYDQGNFDTWRIPHGPGEYLSPFFSPTIMLTIAGHVISPAILILGAPAGFRVTCYYYRKAYYRAFLWDPPGCAVPEVRKEGQGHYTGETKFPFFFQNLHRFFFYLAVVVVIFLWYDAVQSFRFADGWHVNVVSLVFLLNVVLVSAYTFSCHSFRHLLGSSSYDCFSCDGVSQTRYGFWKGVSKLNENHMLWAWLSLFSLLAVDLAVRFVASGKLHDVRLI